MKANPLLKWHQCLLLTVLTLLPLLAAHAQDPYSTPPPPIDPLAGIPVQVLDQQQVNSGDHVITLNRIAPPNLPTFTPSPTPATQPQAQTNAVSAGQPTTRSARTRSVAKPRSAQTSDASGEQSPGKTYKIVFLSTTVYDRQFTELRWYGGNTPEFRVYVNMDFNLFTGIRTVETADTVYDLMFGLGNDTVDTLTQAGRSLPDFSQSPAGHCAYQIIQGSEAAYPEDASALATLCAYYDANKAQLTAAYQQHLANQAAHDQWVQDHPSVPQDTVMNFWPVKNSAYLGQAH